MIVGNTVGGVAAISSRLALTLTLRVLLMCALSGQVVRT